MLSQKHPLKPATHTIRNINHVPQVAQWWEFPGSFEDIITD
jgi:hypothetical protein